MTTEWTQVLRQQAQAEGWDIFQTDSLEHGPFELSKIDDPLAWDDLDYDEPKFANDDEVWQLVLTKAGEGSVLHRTAADFIRENSPMEWGFMMVYWHKLG
jgi:hypothetical protein